MCDICGGMCEKFCVLIRKNPDAVKYGKNRIRVTAQKAKIRVQIILYMICIFAVFASLTETDRPTTGENRAAEAHIERGCPCAPDGTREGLAQTARKCKFELREIHYTAHSTRSFVRKPSFPMFPRPVGSRKVWEAACGCKALCVPLQCTRNACAGGVFDRHPTAILSTFRLSDRCQ